MSSLYRQRFFTSAASLERGANCKRSGRAARNSRKVPGLDSDKLTLVLVDEVDIGRKPPTETRDYGFPRQLQIFHHGSVHIPHPWPAHDSRVPAAPVEASLLEGVMLVDGNWLGRRTGRVALFPWKAPHLVHHAVLVRTSAANSSRQPPQSAASAARSSTPARRNNMR